MVFGGRRDGKNGQRQLDRRERPVVRRAAVGLRQCVVEDRVDRIIVLPLGAIGQLCKIHQAQSRQRQHILPLMGYAAVQRPVGNVDDDHRRRCTEGLHDGRIAVEQPRQQQTCGDPAGCRRLNVALRRVAVFVVVENGLAQGGQAAAGLLANVGTGRAGGLPAGRLHDLVLRCLSGCLEFAACCDLFDMTEVGPRRLPVGFVGRELEGPHRVQGRLPHGGGDRLFPGRHVRRLPRSPKWGLRHRRRGRAFRACRTATTCGSTFRRRRRPRAATSSRWYRPAWDAP
jgi:hypothetical protein